VHCSCRHGGALAARKIPAVLGAAFKQIGKNRAASRQFSDSHIDSHLAQANPLWRAPRIHGEVKKLGIEVSERTVSRILQTVKRPPSQTWKTFLQNHFGEIVAIDFFTVPTICLRVLFVFLVIEHRRRRVLHFGVSEHPTAEWAGQQVIEAFSERDAKR